MSENPFVAFAQLYRNNPVLFVKEVLGVKPDPWQEEFLGHIAANHRRISVRSGPLSPGCSARLGLLSCC